MTGVLNLHFKLLHGEFFTAIRKDFILIPRTGVQALNPTELQLPGHFPFPFLSIHDRRLTVTFPAAGTLTFTTQSALLLHCKYRRVTQSISQETALPRSAFSHASG